MKNRNDRPHLFLVGELLAQVLAESRRKLSGVVSAPAQVERLARRRRRRSASTTATPPFSPEETARFWAELVDEVKRQKYLDGLRRRAEESKGSPDAMNDDPPV